MDESKNFTSSLITPNSVLALISGTLGSAFNILCAKYGSQLPMIIVVVVCTIPFLLCIFFIWRFVKNCEWLNKIFKHIFIYFLIVLIILPFLYYSITMSHYFSIKNRKAVIIPASESYIQGNTEMKNQIDKSLDINSKQAPSSVSVKKQIKRRKEYALREIKIDKIPSLGNELTAISSGNTQTCIGSNCVQGNNYGKMEINQYGPAKLLMTDDQELAVTKTMWLYAGSKFEIILNQVISDLDSKNYAEKLRNALLNAKMICTGYGNTVIFSDEPIPPGIYMTVGSDKEYVMNALRNVLETDLPKELVSAKVIDAPSDTLKIIITPNH